MSQSDSSPTKKQKLDDGLGNGKSQNKIGAVGIRKEKDNEVENAKHKRPHYNPFESGFDALSFSDFSPYNYYYTSPSYDPCHTLSSPFDYFLCGAPSYLHSPNTNYSPTTPEYYPCHTLSSTDSFPTKQLKLEAGLGNGKSRNETGDEIKEVNFLEILEKKDNEAENEKHAHYDPYGYGGSPFGTGCGLSYYPQYHPYSSHDSDTSPDYGSTSSYCTTFPDDSPTSPHYRLPSPYWPTSPGYYPPSHYRSTSPDHSPTSPYSPTHPQYCPTSPHYRPTSPHYRPTSPQHSPTLITPSKGYGFGPVDIEAENKTSDHIKEIGDESCHMGGRNYHEAVATRMIHVPRPKVALLVGAVATLRFLRHDLCGRIRILKDSEVDLKSAQRPVELTGTVLQIEYAQQLIDSVLAAEENHHEPMEEETKKTIFSERERL